MNNVIRLAIKSNTNVSTNRSPNIENITNAAKTQKPSNDSIVNYYLQMQEEFSEKYGDKTILLMQIGTFYETYTYIPEKDPNREHPKKIGLSDEIASLLNICLTMKDNSKPYSFSNCNMAGFPMISYERNRDLLLANAYTIVRMDQKKEGKKVERYVAEILSPATNLENITNLPLTNNIMSIYIEVLKENQHFEDYHLLVGLSYLDVTTGENSVLETYSKEKDAIYATQEIYRFLSISRPREVIINLVYKPKEISKLTAYENFLKTQLKLDDYPVLIFKNNKLPADIDKIEYLSKFLYKIFLNFFSPNMNTNMNTNANKFNIPNPAYVMETLNLERSIYGVKSYVILLQYCWEHNPYLTEKINKPNTSWLDAESYLILTHNAVQQLDLLPNNHKKVKENRSNKVIDSVFSVVNHTKTHLGKRYLLNMLTHPITNPDKLNKMYDITEELIQKRELLASLRNSLKHLPDLERYQRKLYLKIIKPNEFSILFNAYKKIVEIYCKICESPNKLQALLFNSQEFNLCLSNVLSKYKLNVLEKCKLEKDRLLLREKSDNIKEESEKSYAKTYEKDKEDGNDETEEENEEPEEKETIILEENLFYEGVDTKCDQYFKEYKDCYQKINRIVNILNDILEKTRGKKISYSLKDKKEKNLALWTTVSKANVILKSQYPKDICGDLKMINVKKSVMITSDVIAQTCDRLIRIQEELSKYLYSCYQKTLSEISQMNFFSLLNNFIGQLDYFCSSAKCAILRKYIKPLIKEKSHLSFLEIEDMRHPLIEAIIDTPYVTNNISLGKETSSSYRGMLLYGMNSSGKSSLAKAIAVNLILAQAGLFTAGKMTFYPFNKIITRLSGNDSILTGESSFIIEMKELRTILRNADENTLVLGDELSRGTETISATSLTLATLEFLKNKNSCYLFSSHLHDLVDMNRTKELGDNLKICHLSLRYDAEENVLIYDRKLKDGAGDSVYGLEVARSLNLAEEFIKKAYEIRTELLYNAFNYKRSRYNTKVILDSCILCGQKDISKLATHHIIEQEKSDMNGFIDSVHKNIPGNLVPICQDCHKHLHTNGLELNTLTNSKGITLSILNS